MPALATAAQPTAVIAAQPAVFDQQFIDMMVPRHQAAWKDPNH
jgi:uncharacterized protein (DUF305 family)